MRDFVLVGLGGLLGSIGRFSIYTMFLKSAAEKSYLATLTVNLVGSLLIGILVGYGSRLNSSMSVFLVSGLCGGFTTFSAFSMDGIRLLKNGLYLDFAIYSSLSMIFGLILCGLGYILGSRL